MPKKKYTPTFKANIVISIIQGEKEFNEICAENNLNPNMVRKWKQEFFDNAHLAFGADTERKAALRKETDLKRKCILRLNCHIFTVKLPQYNGETATLKTVLPR